MPDQLQLRGGTTAEHATFTGASKEVTIDTTKKTAVVHDASTAGGNPLMREDGANSALINGSATEPALAFAAGDADNGIYSPGDDQVAISTAGQGRLFVRADGKVGIDKAEPGALLDVNGDALINGLTIGMGADSLTGNTAIGDDVLGNATTGGENNTGVGFNTLQDLTTGINNTAVGAGAGSNVTEGGSNSLFGRVAGAATTTGTNNNAFGTYALQNNTTGSNNNAFGSLTLNNNVAGNNGVAVGQGSQRYVNNQADSWTNNNTSVGYESLRGSTTPADNTGIGNTAVGYSSLQNITEGNNNTAIGAASLQQTTTGGSNTGLGYGVLANNTTGYNNVALGSQALASNVAGRFGIAIGLQSQFYANDQTTGWGNTNTSVGYQALRGSATAADNTGLTNVAIGYQSLFDNTTGSTNTAIGYQTLYDNTTGINNVVVGGGAMAFNTEGGNNVAIGTNAFRESRNVDNCTAIGYESQRYANDNTGNTDGNNTSVGYRALRGSTTPADNTGTYNTAVGVDAMQVNTSGYDNVAIGGASLISNTTGYYNVAVGLNALRNNIGSAKNTAIGYNSGRYEQDGSNDANWTNCTYLGFNTRASGDDQVQLGDSTTTTYAYGAVQDRSDERDKADIRDTVIGLDFINSLRPVDFRWDMRDYYFDTEVYEEEETETVEVPNPAYLAPEPNPAFEPGGDEPEYIGGNDEPEFIEETRTKMVTKDRLVPVAKDGSRKRNRFHHGLIAQEVKAAADAAGVDFAGYQDHSVNGGKDVLTIGYTELIAPLIKAVQELTAENAAMKARLDALEAN